MSSKKNNIEDCFFFYRTATTKRPNRKKNYRFRSLTAGKIVVKVSKFQHCRTVTTTQDFV